MAFNHFLPRCDSLHCVCPLLLLSYNRESALQRAEGEKITRVKAAEAEAEASYLQGMGISRQRQASVGCLCVACDCHTCL
jgi:hypothetical protein